MKAKAKDEEFFKDAVKEMEDDPYLTRYMSKENLNRYHYLAHRIDERVNKIVEKYDA
jgi:hypothetical protein